MNQQQMQRIDQKFFKFREFVNDFYKEFEAGRLSSNMMETQNEMLQARANELTEKCRKAEEELSNVITATNTLKNEAQAFVDQKKADGMALWAKANAKFKEIEKHIDDADKRRLKASLKELETIAA